MTEEGGGASRTTDPASGTSAATDVSLREYLMQAITASRAEFREGLANLEKTLVQAERSNKDAIDKALVSIDKRFDNVNEFRGALNDLSRTMATHADVKNLSDKADIAVSSLEQRFMALNDRNRADLEQINKRLDLREGQTTGSRITGGVMVTIVTVGVAVLGLIIVAASFLTR